MRMKALAFLRDRLISGLTFLLPIIILLWIARHVLQFVAGLLHPLASRLPTAGLTGPVVDYVVAAVILALLALVAGILVTSGPLTTMGDRLEQFAQQRIPGYMLFRSYFRGPGDNRSLQVLLVTLDDAWLFGFLMEELPDGMLAVFIPGVPSPTGGSLYFFTEQQVKRTDISVKEAMKCLARIGVGSSRLVTGRLPTGA